MRREQPRGPGLGGQVGVDTEQQVGLAGGAFESQSIQYRNAILEPDQLQIAVTGLFERGLHLRAGAPLAGKGVVGVNDQRRLGSRGGGSEQAAGGDGKPAGNTKHEASPFRRKFKRRDGRIRRIRSHPYASINWIRFIGLAFASQLVRAPR